MSTPITSIKKPRASMKTKTVSVSAKSHAGGTCSSCNLLPVGSHDLTALLLVLVFSVSAVLFTTVYALNLQQAKVAQLQTMLSSR